MTYDLTAHHADELCSCGAVLPDAIQLDSWLFHGFCHAGCAAACDSGYYLTGTPAIEMAEREGARGGPGFERPIVLAWQKAGRPDAPIMLARISDEAERPNGYGDYWCWRLYSGGHCHGMRLTRKAAAR